MTPTAKTKFKFPARRQPFYQFGILSVLCFALVQSQAESDECEYLSSLRACRPVAKGWIALPNSLGHKSQDEITNSPEYRFLENASLALEQNQDDLDAIGNADSAEARQRCEIQIYQLACSVIAPRCHYVDRIRVNPVLPCRTVCKEVRSRCEHFLRTEDLQWPDFLRCDRFHDCHLPSVCRQSKDILAPISRSSRWRPMSVSRPKRHKYRVLPPYRFRHNTPENMIRILKNIALSCPDVARLYSVGKSVQKRSLLVIEFSDNPGRHDRSEPEMKWIGAIHGNEVLGREMLIAFAHLLCSGWRNNNKRIRSLLETTRIHIMPCMNPDGYHKAALQAPHRRDWLTGRYSAKGYDLNRNFPDLTSLMYVHERHGGPNHHLDIPASYWREKSETRLPEIYAVIKWIKRYPFVLSSQLHGGELVANYPYDVRRPRRERRRPYRDYAQCPDDQLFRSLCSLYAQNHLTMANAVLNDCDSSFGEQGGITNGADWYTLHGGMQDFNYLHTNCFETTIEIGCVKFPPAEVLSQEWQNNKESMLLYTEAVHWGIKGLVLNGDGEAISNATVHVAGIDHDVTTSELGEYWRLLLPGTYRVTVSQKGFFDATREIEVTSNNTTMIANFVLQNS